MIAADPVGFDLHDDLIGVDVAAELAGVGRDVIYQWIHRRHLPVVRDVSGRPRMRGIDVLRAEAATRRRGRRG